jgi:hypothetical protein
LRGRAAQAAGNAITVNAPGANVTLRGLTLEGAGVAYNGIVFTAGGSLTVPYCVVHFNGDGLTGNGILMMPTSDAISFAITNSIFSNTNHAGFNKKSKT